MRRCWPACAARSMRSSPATTRCSARFAAAIDSFPEASGGWWNRLLLIGEKEQRSLDVKKAGIFPIVHGVRSLALREHVAGAPGTLARLDALVAAGRLPAALATDLADSLHFLMWLQPEGRARRTRDRAAGVGRRRGGAPEQPGARPAEGRARRGQALQGAACGTSSTSKPDKRVPCRAGPTRCAAAGCSTTWPTRASRSCRTRRPRANGSRSTARPPGSTCIATRSSRSARCASPATAC